MTRHLLTKILAGITVLGATGITVDSSADIIPNSTWLMPGLACRYYGPMGSDTYLNPVGFGANGIKNTSSSDIYVACPITKHYAAATGQAKVYLSNPDEYCALYARWGSGVYHYNTANVFQNTTDFYEYYLSPAYWYDTRFRSVSMYCSLGSQEVLYSYDHEPMYP